MTTNGETVIYPPGHRHLTVHPIGHRHPFRREPSDCPCCHGSGVQKRTSDGLTIECPCCHGTGRRKKKPFDIRPSIGDTR